MKSEFHQYKSPILINDKDINEIVVSNKFPSGKQDFKYFTVYKNKENKENNKGIRPSWIYFLEMNVCKRYSDKTKWMYFMIKSGKKIDRYMTIWEKASSIIKQINIENMYNKKYLKPKKRINTKESFQCFYISVILFH